MSILDKVTALVFVGFLMLVFFIVVITAINPIEQEAEPEVQIIFVHTEEDFCGLDDINLKRLSVEQIKEFMN